MTEEETMDAGALRALERMREFAEHSTNCIFAADLSGINGDEWAGAAARPCNCGFDKALNLYDAALAAAREPVAPAEAEPPGLREALAELRGIGMDGIALDQWEQSAQKDLAAGEAWSAHPKAVLGVIAVVRSALAQPPAPVSAEAAWEALSYEVTQQPYPSTHQPFAMRLRAIIDAHRPAIEAAIRGAAGAPAELVRGTGPAQSGATGETALDPPPDGVAPVPLPPQSAIEAAWQEAEAALPEGWTMAEVSPRFTTWTQMSDRSLVWVVDLTKQIRAGRAGGARYWRKSAEGATPADALLALAAALRGQPSETPAAGDGEAGS